MTIYDYTSVIIVLNNKHVLFLKGQYFLDNYELLL